MQIKHILSLCYKWANFNFALKIAKSHWKIFIIPSRKLLYISLEIVILPSQNCCINSACNNHAYLWCCVRNLPIYANSSSKIKMPGQRLSSTIQRNLISLFDIYVVLLKAPIDIFQNISYWLVRCEKCW